MDQLQYQQAIDACARCISDCLHCAISCTKEEHPEMMVECIRENLNCAALCEVAIKMMSMETTQTKRILLICAEACSVCHKICRQHPEKHCQVCASSCEHCANMCLELAA